MSLKLIVAGMHRSGTSLTASFVDALGIAMGERLLAADPNNRKGYFEDVDFLEFHRAVLTAATRPDEPGIHDWGWTVSEFLDTERFTSYTGQARELIRAREESQPAWGWKDPRTTVMLDFWHELLPDARYLLVYRAPWDVVESMMRVGGDYFPAWPDHSLRIWAFYNRHLLEFYRAHRDRCVLFNINAFIAEPEKLAHLIQQKLGIAITDESAATRFRDLYSGDLFHALAPDHPVVQLCRHLAPRPLELLAELERESDLPGHILPDDAPGVEPDRLEAWPFYCHRETIRERNEAQARLEVLRTELEGELARYRHYIENLNAELAQVRADLYHQNLAATEEKHRLQKQVTDLFRLSEDRKAQVDHLLEEIKEVYSRADALQWENSQLAWERDQLRQVIASMEQTRIWRLREKVRRLAGRR